jgi:L-threonylcarbamoyladenylate synthase
MTTLLPVIDKSVIRSAVEAIKSGGVVSIPTETVYGLACDPTNHTAIAKIFALKGRAVDVPIAILASSIKQIEAIAQMDERAYRLFTKFAPGPLTLILPLKQKQYFPSILTGGRENIGVRIVAHPVAAEIIDAFGAPLAATSANLSGQASATDSSEVNKYFAGKLDFIVEAEPSRFGVSSTVVDLTAATISLLRIGTITETEIDKILNKI